MVFKTFRPFFPTIEKTASFYAPYSSDLPDTLSMPNALKVLEDNGFPTSKAKLYKMTSQEQIPFMKYGNKLVFSRKALIEWAHKQLISNRSEDCNSAINIQKCFKRKR